MPWPTVGMSAGPGHGSLSAGTASGAAAAALSDGAQVPPAISGLTIVGQTLTTTSGSGYGTFLGVYQWQRSIDGVFLWSNISGATTSGHRAVVGDVNQYLRARAQWDGGDGPEWVDSAAVGPITNIA